MALDSFKFWKPKSDPQADQVVRRSNSSFFGGWFGFGNDVGKVKTPETALEIAAVYSAVTLISRDVARMPINLVSRKVDGKNRESWIKVRNHPLHKILTVAPNATQTPFEFISTIMTQLLLTGQSLSIKIFDGAGKLTGIVPMPAGSYSYEQLATGKLVFKVTFDSGIRTYSQEEVMFIRSGLSLDGFNTFNPTVLARSAYSITSGLEKIVIGLANSGGRPSGLITSDEALGSDETEADIAAEFSKKYSSGGSGGIAILTAPNVKFTPLTTTLVDAQFDDTRRFQVAEVARIFNVPFEKLLPSTKSYASAIQVATDYVKNCLMPYVVCLEQAMRRDLLNGDINLSIDFDNTDLLRGSPNETADYVMKLLSHSGGVAAISVNEAREELGLEPLDGDEYEKPGINRGQVQSPIVVQNKPSE